MLIVGYVTRFEGVEDQDTEKIREYCYMRDYDLLGIFQEWINPQEDTLSFRSEFFRAVLESQANQATILVATPNSIERNPIFRATILHEARKREVKVFSMQSGTIDLAYATSSGDKAVYDAVDTFAAYVRNVYQYESLWHAERQKKEGSEFDPQTFGELEGEAEIRDKIIALRKEGWTYKKITKLLDDNNMKPRGGGKWQSSSVLSICKKAGI